MKRILNSKVLILALVSVIVLVLLTGCSSNEASSSNESDVSASNELKGHVTLVGSTSVTPVAQEIAEAFMKINPKVKVDVQGVGSSAGIKSSHDKVSDFGMSSRNLKTGEKEWGLNEHVIAFDGIAVVVNPKNGVKDLTKEEATKIFKGQITNWKEVGGVDKEILVISREAGSGTRGAFEELMDLEKKNSDGKKISAVIKNALIAEGNGAVKANVAKKEYAIGYLSLSYLDNSIQTVKIDGVDPTTDNIVNGTYNISRPFLLLSNGELSKEAKAYLDFVMSDEGQKIISKKLISIK
ncbi:phosphate ABC transporter substrate-binding protein [Helicovermis profundi]|uniref:Phosphate-binding protein n=1 Tax=Helicovermis profundi TaxID=3065157 RepID=A0AAU9EK49_9FIRM|nr:phosphate ABC transporter substrate-binding protein [Clostridia bacterium S502]